MTKIHLDTDIGGDLVRRLGAVHRDPVDPPAAGPQAVVQPGRMLYEMEGIDEKTAREAFRLAAAKLSVQTSFVTRTVM